MNGMAHPAIFFNCSLTLTNTFNGLGVVQRKSRVFWAMFHIPAHSQLVFRPFIYGCPGRPRHTRPSKYLARNSAPVTLNTFICHRLSRDVSSEPHWCNCALWSLFFIRCSSRFTNSDCLRWPVINVSCSFKLWPINTQSGSLSHSLGLWPGNDRSAVRLPMGKR